MVTKQFNTLCMTFTNTYNKETFLELTSVLAKFGEKSNKAMSKYLINPPSAFLDWSHLMKLIRNEYRISLKLLDDKDSYAKITNDVSSMGSRKPNYHPIIERTIIQMGGWKYLCDTPNSSFISNIDFKSFDESLTCL